MRASLFALVSTAFCLAAAPAITPALAADTPKDVKGLFLLTDYPAMSVLPGTTSTIALRLQNYGLSPERYSLSVGDVPAGWTATLLGGGQPVAAAMPATDASVSLLLGKALPAHHQRETGVALGLDHAMAPGLELLRRDRRAECRHQQDRPANAG